MHELTIAQSILETSIAHACEARATRILRIRCRVGWLRQVEASLLAEAFEVAKTDTIAAGAVLEADCVGTELACAACGRRSLLTGGELICPACGSGDVAAHGGDELELTSLEVEVPDEDRGPAQESPGNQRAGCGGEPQFV
ncbi:MAG: hydrogenase maturation nickel metallochaperone HypA [Planctomycetes bacterium]|nr:hydrogenase maturation nickel metallochaperone HypA [Planctomycetota bacterium]